MIRPTDVTRPDLRALVPDNCPSGRCYGHHASEDAAAAKWHELWTELDGSIEGLDEVFHDHLPPFTNCRWCGVLHAAIHPDLVRRYR